MARTKTTQPIVADICLYGTSWTGAGYLGVIMPHGRTFGTGEPVKGRTFTEAVWHGLFDIRAAGVTSGRVRIFEPGGERMSIVDVNAATIYGSLVWEPAIVYTISADALIAASDKGQA